MCPLQAGRAERLGGWNPFGFFPVLSHTHPTSVPYWCSLQLPVAIWWMELFLTFCTLLKERNKGGVSFQDTKLSHWFNIRYPWAVRCTPSLFSGTNYSRNVSEKLLTCRSSQNRKKGLCKHFTSEVAFPYSVITYQISYIGLMYCRLIIVYFCCISKYVKLKASDCMQIILCEAF